MKKIALLLITVLLSGVKTIKAQEQELSASEPISSGCLSRSDGEEVSTLATIKLTKEGSILSVDLLNYNANCGTTGFEVENRISGGNDDIPSVTISVVPVVPAEMDCYCPFNISYTVRGLEVNKFCLSCWWFDGQVELTDGESLVLEYKTEDVVIDGLRYRLLKTAHQAKLLVQNTLSDEVEIFQIPSEVEYEGEKYIVTSINENVFVSNNGIKKIIIPKTIKNTEFGGLEGITGNPFSSCLSLETIEVEEGNPVFCSIDGVLFNKDKTKLICYPANSPRESYTVPDGVKTAVNGAFISCQHLKKIVLPDDMSTLGISMFVDSKNLEEVILPSNIKELPVYLFRNCIGLKSVVIPEGVTTIGYSAFEGCRSLDSISLPESVATVGMTAFSGCTSLESATLSPNLKEIPLAMFRDCSKLAKVIIPFGITTIGNGAFAGCEAMQSLDLPVSINYIDNFAFRYLSKLRDFYCHATTVPNTANRAFNDVDLSQVTLHVPAASVSAYQAVEPWKNFKEIVALPAQDDYRPLVEEGKHWTYDNYMPLRPAEYDHYYYYDLKGDTIIAGKKCLKMYSENRANDGIVRYEGALYEEYKKVYCFMRGKDVAELLYDFDCKVGDTLSISEGQMVVKDIQMEDNGDIAVKKYTLKIVWDYEEDYVVWIEGVGAMMDFFGMVPAVGNYNSLNACELNGEKLYQYIEPDLTEKGYHKMAIEGKRWNYIHYYLDEEGEHRVPYSYVVKGDTIIRRSTYKKLWYQDEKTEQFVCLLYEAGRTIYKNTDLGNNSYDLPLLMPFFEFERKDFGRMFTWKSEVEAGNTNWMVYGVDTIDVKGQPFRRYTCLQKYSNEGQSLSTIAYDGEGVWHDIWVEGVGSASSGIENQIPYHEPPVRQPNDYTYFVSCYENGECVFTAEDFNAPATKPVTDMAYRPFVEEGKVWKVGSEGSGNPVQWVEYYYFDGDTIIDGKTCKQMMLQRFVSPAFAESNLISQYSLSYAGAWYEEDKKVYFYDAFKQFRLWYDFSLEANGRIENLPLYVVGPKQTGGIKGFKGVYRDVMSSWGDVLSVYNTTWLEGVGCIDGPIYNVYYGDELHTRFLMACYVGDEVIYLNDEYEDGATPEFINARKQRIDFTHTIKIKPKSRIKREESDACISSSERDVTRPKVKSRTRREAEPSLYGEYSEQQLGINLNPLDDAYEVRITDETGRVVYEKTVNAGNIVGLNIDISAYAEGRYTVTVENDNESFTGQFETLATGISDAERLNDNGEMINDNIYNLQGQRISAPRKGLNIVDGRKVFVK